MSMPVHALAPEVADSSLTRCGIDELDASRGGCADGGVVRSCVLRHSFENCRYYYGAQLQQHTRFSGFVQRCCTCTYSTAGWQHLCLLYCSDMQTCL